MGNQSHLYPHCLYEKNGGGVLYGKDSDDNAEPAPGPTHRERGARQDDLSLPNDTEAGILTLHHM